MRSMVGAIVHDSRLVYPSGDDFFSPDVAWPEYRFGHLARTPNPVYSAVRACLADAGLDRERFGTRDWNPLGQYISPGQKVFVLCNFVEHRVGAGGDEAFFGKCTHGSVVRAVMDYALLALGGHGEIAFGNAPLQSCDWSVVTEQSGAARVQEFYRRFVRGSAEISLVDLRQRIVRRGALGGVSAEFHSDRSDVCVNVELGEDSLLERLYGGGAAPRFRVLDYDPRRTASCHEAGRHTYIVNRRIVESDTIISVPKLKTHEKVGITCGIKGCVGTVAHKDCLAHHRYGPPKQDGDEYPDSLAVLGLVSAVHDLAYTRRPGLLQGALHASNYFSRKVIRRFTRAVSGSWPGNDTCWRMAVDLARIVRYADTSGAMSAGSRRHHLLLTDGIIAGEGDGPLSPRPVRFGYLCFCDDVAVGDYVNCLAMGFDPDKIPVVREAFRLNRYPLTTADPLACSIPVNGRVRPVGTLGRGLRRKFLPPAEWRNAL